MVRKKNIKNIKKDNNLVIYQAKNGAIEFRGDFERDTIWATQKQIAEIFGINRTVVTKHINKIFKDGEVKEKSNVHKMHIANSDKPVKFYNLDIILAVGYKTNSSKAIEFRKWVSDILKQHITKGYTLNKKVIKNNYDEFLDAVEKIQKLLPKGNVIPAGDVLELVKTFADTWVSIDAYDKGDLPKKGFTKKKVKIQADELYGAVSEFKKNLIKRKEATELFAQEKNQKSLEGILGNVFQIIFGEDVYKTVEEKASHLLYFIIKNHPFNDGNKRTGAFTFVWFLNKAGVNFYKKITSGALTAITVLIAESNPKDKDRMIGLVLLLLKNKK